MSPSNPIDSRSPKEFWDEQHQRLAEEPIAWVLRADELIAAFEVLAADIESNAASHCPPSTSSVALMLAGFAIENILKAFLVANRNPLNSKGRFEFATHKLLKLATNAQLAVSSDEARLLERLEEFVAWAGRYPVPLTSEAMRPRTLATGGFAPVTYHFVGEDFEGVRALIVRMKKLLPKIIYA